MALTDLSLQIPTYIVKLDNTQLLFIKGPDSAKFLQGQVTCDVRELSSAASRIGAQCNIKGRILLSFRALQIDAETIALRIPTAMAESAHKSLGKYIVFSKATLSSSTEDFHLFGLFGPHAKTTALAFFNQLPTEDEAWVETDGNYLIQLSDARYECWISSRNILQFQQQTKENTLSNDINSWNLLNIRAGIADIYPETIEIFTPQEINYQLINGVSFRKGCYTGQEIVARLHYRGKLKRHMYRFSLVGSQLPKLGTPLINTETGQICGHLVSAAHNSNKEIEILASLLDERLDQVNLDSNQENLKQLTLPYAIPTADEKTD